MAAADAVGGHHLQDALRLRDGVLRMYVTCPISKFLKFFHYLFLSLIKVKSDSHGTELRLSKNLYLALLTSLMKNPLSNSAKL